MNIIKIKYLFLISLLTFCADYTMNATPSAGSGCVRDGVEQVVKIPTLPAELSFAGEKVPLQYMDVRESLQREMMVITYWHASLAYILQLNNRYEAVIRKILKEEGIPEDFYFLCIAESGLQPVVSSASAGGYWQFLSGTAKDYGLVVNDEVDERYNIEKSTRAAAAYFKNAYKELGTWTMAAASFNIGLSNVRYRMEIQSQRNYYDTQFPEETARYLFRALAFKTILSSPENYGFLIEKDQLYPPYQYTEVAVDSSVENWSAFAAKYQTNFKMLKTYNQWIRSNKLENKDKKNYIVKVPKEGSR